MTKCFNEIFSRATALMQMKSGNIIDEEFDKLKFKP